MREDHTTYYDVKIKAKLLLSNTGNTFVTPVFNGSASLRDAAGQMIENTVKSVRRNQTIDDAYMEKLFADMTSLHRLDQLNGTGSALTSGKTEFGRLPNTALVLLASLAVAWVLIIIYVGWQAIKKRRNQQ